MRNFRNAAGLLEAARRDSGSYRERLRLPSGTMVECRSTSERNWWEQFTEALSKGHIKPDDMSIRNIFCEVIPEGRSICDEWRQGGEVSLQEAAGAVSAATFSNITGQIVYSKILDAYQMPEYVFSRMIPTIKSEFLEGEKMAGLQRIGDHNEVVEEGYPFPLAGFGEDWINTPRTKKRGLIVPVTREAVFADRTGHVMKHASEVGEFLAVNREIRAADCVIDENTTAHRHKWKDTSYATYQASTPWINSATSNGLESWANIDAVEKLASEIVDPYTGLPVNIALNTLICNLELSHRAHQIFSAETIFRITGGYATSGNLNQQAAPTSLGRVPGYSTPYQIVSSRWLKARTATDTNWFMCDPSKAFAYMENWPLAVVQAPPNNTAEFERDIVAQYKASERGAYTVLNPRYTFKSAA